MAVDNSINIVKAHVASLEKSTVTTKFEHNKLYIHMDNEIVKYYRHRINRRSGSIRDPLTKYKVVLQDKIIESLTANEIIIDDETISNPISVTMYFRNTPPASKPVKKLSYMLLNIIKRTTTPDIDNFVKTSLDVLNKLAWSDDGQVIELHAYKQYDTEKSTDIVVEYLDDANKTLIGRINEEDKVRLGSKIINLANKMKLELKNTPNPRRKQKVDDEL